MKRVLWVSLIALVCLHPGTLRGQNATQGPVKITLDQAIQLALQQNHSLLANRTNVQQGLALEVTANLRPNPTVFADWAYLPIVTPEGGWGTYLHDLSEIDAGVSYTIERGGKRARRLQAAKDATTVTRTQVLDNERTLTFQVASDFINAQLANSMVDLAQQNLKSFQDTVDVAQNQYRAGGISENDFQKIKLQLLQFETDLQTAQLTRAQALADLRQQLGYEAVPADFDISGTFEYQPLMVSLDQLQAKALENRPDLRAALQSITAAKSQLELAKANGKQDLGVTGNYSHVNAGNHVTFAVNIPLPIFDRNQGEIARTQVAMTQARQQEAAAHGQVLTDVKQAYDALVSSDRVAQLFRTTYLNVSQRSRDISEYSYRRGAGTLLDFLDAERSYRATQLAYRQALATYLTAIEQLRQVVGTRSLQ
ncbi:MAG: TolC family protein [Acidobacteriia bacterium]|nr:TolC family protein [Terriglobia bacterium]